MCHLIFYFVNTPKTNIEGWVQQPSGGMCCSGPVGINTTGTEALNVNGNVVVTGSLLRPSGELVVFVLFFCLCFVFCVFCFLLLFAFGLETFGFDNFDTDSRIKTDIKDVDTAAIFEKFKQLKLKDYKRLVSLSSSWTFTCFSDFCFLSSPFSFFSSLLL